MANGLSDTVKYLLRGFVNNIASGDVFNIMDAMDYVNAHNRVVNLSKQRVTHWCMAQPDLQFVSRCEWRRV